VNRISREWNTDTIESLIVQRYPSTVHITRIFRNGQSNTRIRIDFHSQDDVQSIIQNGYIYIDSIRYPATLYKPLTRIDRCYKYQQLAEVSDVGRDNLILHTSHIRKGRRYDLLSVIGLRYRKMCSDHFPFSIVVFVIFNFL